MKSKRPLDNQSNMQNKNFILSESLVNKLSKLLSQVSSAQCHKKKHRKKSQLTVVQILLCYLEHENDGFSYYYFLRRAAFVSKIKIKTTTQNQKWESATKRCFLKYRSVIAVQDPKKTNFEELNSCKKSDFEPANQHNTNILHKYFPENRTTGDKGIYSARKKTCSRILLICRVITIADSEKSKIVKLIIKLQKIKK